MDVGKVVGNLKPTGLPPHQQRVVEEQIELGDRLAKLRDFIAGNPIFAGLPGDEQVRLKTQCFVMNVYWDVLVDRIKNFPVSQAPVA